MKQLMAFVLVLIGFVFVPSVAQAQHLENCPTWNTQCQRYTMGLPADYGSSVSSRYGVRDYYDYRYGRGSFKQQLGQVALGALAHGIHDAIDSRSYTNRQSIDERYYDRRNDQRIQSAYEAGREEGSQRRENRRETSERPRTQPEQAKVEVRPSEQVHVRNLTGYNVQVFDGDTLIAEMEPNSAGNLSVPKEKFTAKFQFFDRVDPKPRWCRAVVQGAWENEGRSLEIEKGNCEEVR